MRYIQTILILVSIIACSKEKQIDENFTSKYWNLCINEKDSALIKYKDQALHFKDGAVYFINEKIANYSISNDTLIVCDTSYYEKGKIENVIHSNGKVDITFYKRIENDSLYQVTFKYLIGRVLKVDSDSLVIDVIEGYGFPFKFQDLLKFYNDSLLYDQDIKIDTIEFSNSLCYGSCPAIAMKIDKGLNYEFWGGENADKKGFYKGKITKEQFDAFEKLIRIANIEGNDSEYFPPIDAPYVELIIDYNIGKTKKFWGYMNDFPVRVKNVGLEMFDLYKSSSLDTCDCELQFEVHLHVQAPPPPPPPEFEILSFQEDTILK